MAKPNANKFRVSAALKNIIGKELITDDFIAVFELVKNSFDAHAAQVDVFFEGIHKDDARLVIWDDGKGMDREDIIKKWLFVAYSAKKEGIEDYRDKIRSNRIHAGSKGIGRFSCDRLGSNLTIYTKKKGRDSKINKLIIDWSDFEKDSQEEFISIGVKHSYVQEVPYENFKHGTILEITGLREGWDRDKLLKLRHSLEKLINPNQENDPYGFSIVLNVEEEEAEDRENKAKGEIRDIVNGRIENKIFENLEIKTTKIEVVISEDGESITTTLEDRGTLIYRVLEENPYKEFLKNINIYLFVLNRSAKINFTKNMGMPSVQYGSIFLYKNGFRIYPFGEPGQDTLKIDHRKQQGTARYFGTRDLIGRIEINGNNSLFQETSSRDGGLIRNVAYETLEKFFIEYVLRRLEKFAIGVIKWGNDGDLLDHKKLSTQDMTKNASDIICNLVRSNDVIDVEYNPKLIDIIKNRTQRSLKTILNNFGKLAEQTDSPLISKEIKRIQRQYDLLVKAKEEAEAETEKAREETEAAEAKATEEAEKKREAEKAAEEAKEEVKQKTSQNLFLQSVMSQDLKNVVSLHHHVGISAGNIKGYIGNMTERLKRGENLSKEVIQVFLEKISYQANIISSIVKFATKANFNLEASELEKPVDIISFIREYALNICSEEIKILSGIDLDFVHNDSSIFELVFRPIEISIIIDNLIENSRKSAAEHVTIEVLSVTDDTLEIAFRDDGKGIPVANRNKIFNFGFSTTDGSGLGLHHVRQVLEDMNGTVMLNKEYKEGAEFILRINKCN